MSEFLVLVEIKLKFESKSALIFREKKDYANNYSLSMLNFMWIKYEDDSQSIIK